MKTLHKRCAGLDVHKTEVVACLRVANRGKASYELRRFPTTTRALIELGDWLEQAGCTHLAMDATGVYFTILTIGLLLLIGADAVSGWIGSVLGIVRWV